MNSNENEAPVNDMSAFQLVYYPHEALDTQVVAFPDGDMPYRNAVSAHMRDLCEHHKGLGLAANQINLNASVFVTHVQGEMVVCFNPQIHEVSDDKVLMSEGCLSEPGLYLKVKRPDMIRASWEDERGERTQATLFGMDCRVFLHEFDHLQGVMFTDRVGKTKLQMARKKQNAYMERAAQRIMANMS